MIRGRPEEGKRTDYFECFYQITHCMFWLIEFYHYA